MLHEHSSVRVVFGVKSSLLRARIQLRWIYRYEDDRTPPQKILFGLEMIPYAVNVVVS
jgi:hypothetical protein